MKAKFFFEFGCKFAAQELNHMNLNLRVLAIATIFLTLNTSAQTDKKRPVTNGGGADYKTGIGLRLGYEAGLTVKHFVGKNAIEGILSRGWGYGGFRLTGLYEFQNPIASTPGLDWYVGFGAHIGAYNGNYYGYSAYNGGYYDKHGNWHPSGYRQTYMVLGIDGILGLEYTFPDAPLNISLDIKPYVDLIGYGSHFIDGALSVRYAIK